MPEQQPHPSVFGPELRRRREEAGKTLGQLAESVHYSKGYLSKVENGRKSPTPDLARFCDAALGARGALIALAPQEKPTTPTLPDAGERHEDEVCSVSMGKDGSAWLHLLDRRQVVAMGASSALSRPLGGAASAAAEGTSPIEVHKQLFDTYRQLGQRSAPDILLPQLAVATYSTQREAVRSAPRARRELLVLAARYAEYTGWMAQESGDDRLALWWTNRAVEYAQAGEDHGLAVYALVRRALVSLLRGGAAEAVELTGRALASDAPPRVRGLAAQQQAQAHAGAGDHTASMRSLDLARDLLERAAEDPGEPVLGTSHLTDVVSMYTGWCLLDLGLPARASEVLDRETARLPEHALRARTRHGVRRALAHAAAGEVDHACALARELLGSAALIHSATIGADLRRLARILRRHPRNASVRAIGPDLAATIATATTLP
jgi:tetratricopeptide (TPR) repeat protein